MSIEELKKLQEPTRMEFADGLWKPGEPAERHRPLDHAERLRLIREGETSEQRVNYPANFLLLAQQEPPPLHRRLLKLLRG